MKFYKRIKPDSMPVEVSKGFSLAFGGQCRKPIIRKL